MLDLLIRNAVVVRETAEPADIGIAGGRFVEIAARIGTAARSTLDARGLHAFPALIDSHVHFNDPGRAEWEGAATGSAALAAGGGAVFFDMPLNSSPPTLDAASFDLKLATLQRASRTDFALWGGLTPVNLEHMEALAQRGVIGFKAFMADSGIEDFLRADDRVLHQGMAIAARVGLPVAVHAESEEITAHLAAQARAGKKTAIRDYLDSRPIHAELDAIHRAIAIAADTGCSLHVVHVSSAAGVREVSAARARGVDVTCETCPHYLALTEEDLERLGACAKCAPPLRPASEVYDLWQQVAAGNIDLVASDHSPAPAEMKTSANFFDVWGGIAGVQSTLPVLLSHRPALPLPQVAALTASHAARRYRIAGKGAIALGNDADLALIDLSASYTLSPEMLLDRHKQSPYRGHTFHGRIVQTLLRGRIIFDHGELPPAPPPRFLRPDPSRR